MIPFQELVHKKKCLLPDSGASGDYDDSISPGGIEPYLVNLKSDNLIYFFISIFQYKRTEKKEILTNN
jgi:hypothetical protein